MTAAVENLITTIRKKNAEEEAKVISQKKQEVINQAKQQKSLSDQAKRSQGAIDKFVGDMKKGKKTKGGEVIASRLSGVEKDQLKTLNDQLASDKQAITSMEQQNRLQELNNKISKDQTQATREMVMRTRGISEDELKSEEQTRSELKMQKQVLEQMLVSDTMTADQIKGTREFQEKSENIARQEKRLETRANRQIQMQNLKQTMSLKGIGKGLDGLKGSIMGIGGSLKGAAKGALDKAGGGLMNMLKVGGLVAAFFGLKAFLDSKLFQQLTEFMKSLAPQFDLVFGGFKKLFQGDIIGGLMDIFLGIGGMVFKVLDSAVTGIFNAIARYFGFEGTDSVFGAIIGAFKKIYEFMSPVIEPIITFAKDAFNSIFSGLTSIFEGVKALFSGDFSIETFLKLFGGLADIAFAGVRAAINAVAGIFGFDGIPGDWSITGALIGAVKKVKEFFGKIFSFDVSGFVSDVKNKLFSFGTMLKGLGAGGLAAAKAILPGGESPAEAFKRVFDSYTKGNEVSTEALNSNPYEGGFNNVDEVALTGGGRFTDDAGLPAQPIVIQSNQNNSVNSSNTQVQQTAVRSHDEIARELTSSHS